MVTSRLDKIFDKDTVEEILIDIEWNGEATNWDKKNVLCRISPLYYSFPPTINYIITELD